MEELHLEGRARIWKSGASVLTGDVYKFSYLGQLYTEKIEVAGTIKYVIINNQKMTLVLDWPSGRWEKALKSYWYCRGHKGMLEIIDLVYTLTIGDVIRTGIVKNHNHLVNLIGRT